VKNEVWNPDGIFGPLDHHGGDLLVQNALELLANLGTRLDDRWTLKQTREGANSLVLMGPTGAKYYFRGAGHGDSTIRVHDRAQHGGQTVAELRTRVQVRNFVRELATTA
jgi:hypothetical protein